jgi:hypothetical protein
MDQAGLPSEYGQLHSADLDPLPDNACRARIVAR